MLLARIVRLGYNVLSIDAGTYQPVNQPHKCLAQDHAVVYLTLLNMGRASPHDAVQIRWP
jgi:hypothetical protein